MKAVILAAGKGTRMGDLTKALPKPMVHVQGRPILETILLGLRDGLGIRDFFLVIGYQGQVITEHFNDGSAWGIRITYGTQAVQDGTGKAPELARTWVALDRFLLTYGDILVDAEDYAHLGRHDAGEGVLAVKAGEDLSKGGAILTDETGRVVEIVEKGNFAVPPPRAYYNAGIYILSPRIFEFTAQLEKSARGEYELTDALRGLIQAGGGLHTSVLQRKWADVRDPQVLALLNATNA